MTPEDMSRLHGAAFERGWSAEEFEALISAKGAIFVSQSNGFALGRVIADEAEVLTIVVDAAQRGGGIGRALLGDLLAQSKSHGACEMFLEVAEDNVAARALYAHFGFVQTGKRANYYSRAGQNTDALVLRRRIF